MSLNVQTVLICLILETIGGADLEVVQNSNQQTNESLLLWRVK